MARPKIKATYSLDEETVRDLETMARRLKISKSEALRRAIRLAAEREIPTGSEQLAALDELQHSPDRSADDLARWAEDARELRNADYRL